MRNVDGLTRRGNQGLLNNRLLTKLAASGNLLVARILETLLLI